MCGAKQLVIIYEIRLLAKVALKVEMREEPSKWMAGYYHFD